MPRVIIGSRYHVLFIPDVPPSVIIDPEAERAEKLLAYYRRYNIMTRYKLLFREFVSKVDAGTWDPYLAK